MKPAKVVVASFYDIVSWRLHYCYPLANKVKNIDCGKPGHAPV